ncbi:Mor transcription activator family protein [Chromobacterium violaceum]|uniref:Mor transcription activator domain-containing protein n=1 Tax=Chromobacterium violaceum (strain ATCC 12472 / DSM 30191 / JCM 1249 / CCUG 213 / NBRC 12614 / NCIMB 9131 / NCTC 9757 / MK) TaxID=243365 RepID=Q7NXZ8_CHRVO|nr:Mor transcription activator family protein [Chromobacterium violaceum]AAQ59153.1 conserved hypothetical protein [Chromobacterium violaceum ATCC 12472]SUX88688.1 Uncharacterized conserved protein [Chromobacterium violaceum]
MRPKEFTAGRKWKSTVSGAEITASLAAVIGQSLQKRGLTEHDSDDIALEVMQEVRRTYGGQNLYFPLEQGQSISERDAEIYQRYTKGELSVQEIALEYSISLQWAYHIIRTVRVKQQQEQEEEKQAQREKERTRWKRENWGSE